MLAESRKRRLKLSRHPANAGEKLWRDLAISCLAFSPPARGVLRRQSPRCNTQASINWDRLTPALRSARALSPGRYDATIVIADGLSAGAVQMQAAHLCNMLLAEQNFVFAAPVVALQGRVALGDEIAVRQGAALPWCSSESIQAFPPATVSAPISPSTRSPA
jgi:Ethanolamine ammonia-lyase light chain (EutC)